MEIEKRKKGFKSLAISISIGLLISFVFYLLYSTHYSCGIAEPGVMPGLFLYTVIVFLGVCIIVSLVYIVLHIRKNQKEAVNVAVINVFVLWLIALIMKLFM